MPGTTPTLGLPYAVATDARAQGADAIQDLAVAVEAHLLDSRPYWISTSGGSGTWGGANTWTTLAYGAQPTSGFGSADAQTYIYTGTTPRMFMLSAGAIVAATSGASPSSKALRIMVNGGPVKSTEGVSERAGLHVSHVLQLNPGDTLRVEAYEGTFPAAYSHAYLCGMSGPDVT